MPYNSNAWIDKKKTQIGYEIPFTRYFYKFKQNISLDILKKEFMDLEMSSKKEIKELFKGET